MTTLTQLRNSLKAFSSVELDEILGFYCGNIPKNKRDKINTIIYDVYGYEKRQVKQPSRKALNEKASIYGWEAIALSNEEYVICEERTGVVMKKSKSLAGIQRALAKLISEYEIAKVDNKSYEFYRKYKVLNIA